MLSTPGLILLVYSLTTGNQAGWGTGKVIATLVIAICLLCAFAIVELRISRHPLIPRYLWCEKNKLIGCSLAALTYAVWQGANYLLTLELQGKAHLYTPKKTSLLLTCDRVRVYSATDCSTLSSPWHHGLGSELCYTISFEASWNKLSIRYQLDISDRWHGFASPDRFSKRLLAILPSGDDPLYRWSRNSLLRGKHTRGGIFSGRRSRLGFWSVQCSAPSVAFALTSCLLTDYNTDVPERWRRCSWSRPLNTSSRCRELAAQWQRRSVSA